GGQGGGPPAVGLLPGDHGVAKDTDFLDFAFHDIAGLEVPGFGIPGESGDARNGAGRDDIASAITHRRIVREDFGDFHGHFAGVRALADFAVHAELHIEIVGIGDLVGGNDMRAERAESVDGLAEAEHAGLHFAALNVARSNVVEDDVAANVRSSL